MIYFWLALLSLVFWSLGFLVHAFLFDRQGRVKNLEKEIESLTRMLARRDQAKIDADHQVADTRMRMQSLEFQLSQKDGQMTELQTTARRQEEEIQQLQKATSELRETIARGEMNRHPPEELEEIVGMPGGERSDKTPLWKDNLNNILEMLEKFEKAGKP